MKELKNGSELEPKKEISEKTQSDIKHAEEVSDEGINVLDESTTISKKSKLVNEKVESKKAQLKNLLERKTSRINFYNSEEYKNFYNAFAALKDANETAFLGALSSIKKEFEKEYKNEIEKQESLTVSEFETVLNYSEVQNLLTDLFIDFDFSNLIEGKKLRCYVSDPFRRLDNKDNKDNKDDFLKNKNLNTYTLKQTDAIGNLQEVTLYYKYLDFNRSNYIKTVLGYSFYLEGKKELKNKLNKIIKLFDNLKDNIKDLKQKGISKLKILDIINDIYNDNDDKDIKE